MVNFDWQDVIGLTLWPGGNLFQGTDHLHEDSIPAKDQAQQAEAFFKALNADIKKRSTSTSLPTLDRKKLGSARLHYAIERLGKLRKDKAIYEANEKSAEAALLELIEIDNDLLRNTNDILQTPLHLLALHGTFQLVETFFKKLSNLLELDSTEKKEQENLQQILVNAKDAGGRTALHMSAFRSEKYIAEYLLQKNASPYISDHTGSIPLNDAATSYAPWIRTLYDATDYRKYNIVSKNPKNNTVVWQKAFKKPQSNAHDKSTVDSASVWELNPAYCLLSKRIFNHYETLFTIKSSSVLVKNAQQSEDLRYTITALPPLLNRVLEDPDSSYLDILKQVPTQEEKSKLACLALHNPRFIKQLATEKKIKQLIELSHAYPRFALNVLQHHIEHIKEPQKSTYLKSLKDRYKALAMNLNSIYEAIANELVLFEIQTAVKQEGFKLRDITDLMKNIPTILMSYFRPDTMLHIAAKFGSVAIIKALLEEKKTEGLINKRNARKKLPLDVALTPEVLNTEAIQLLYDKTTDTDTLKSYLPDYLNRSLENANEREIKACIKTYPYHLTHVLVNAECREKYNTLINTPHQILKAFKEDPLMMLVGINVSIFKEHVQKILKDVYQYKNILELPRAHKAAIGLANAKQLAFALLKQGLEAQETVRRKKEFLQDAVNSFGTVFPQVALYALTSPHKHLLEYDDIAEILKNHIYPHRISILEMQYATDKEKLLQACSKEAEKALKEHIRINETQIEVASKYQQLSHAEEKIKPKLLRASNNRGNKPLHTIMDATDTVEAGLSILTSDPDRDTYTRESIRNFLEVLKMTKDHHKALNSITNQFKDAITNNPYKDIRGNTFLHIAAERGKQAFAMISKIFEQDDLKGFLEGFCNDKNNKNKTPLELALEAKNIPAIQLLKKHTTDMKVWQTFVWGTSYHYKDLSGIKTAIDNEPSNLKEEYILLNHAHSNKFQACIDTITSSQDFKRNIQTLDALIKSEPLLRYSIVDSQHLFECLLASSDVGPIKSLFNKKGLYTPYERSLLKLLNNQMFYNALRNSTHHEEVTEYLAKEYNILNEDGGKTTLDELRKTLQYSENRRKLMAKGGTAEHQSGLRP